MNALQTDVVSALHVEGGILECGEASGWNSGYQPTQTTGYYLYTKRISVTFSKPYSTPPRVFLSDAARWIRNTDGGRDDVYGKEVIQVTTTGFTMFCGTHTDSLSSPHASYMGDLHVNWISIST